MTTGLFHANPLSVNPWLMLSQKQRQLTLDDAFITNIAHPCTRHAHPLRKPFT
jgi:hypothetical protein